LTSGTLPPPNNANEGHVGATITSIASFAEVPLSWNGTKSGNVVLLMAGTNDMFNSTMAAAAPAQLGSLIDEIVAAWPQAAVLVASLTPFVNNVSEANVLIFNPTIPGIVSERAAAGKRVLFVSMANVTVGELYDGLHPDDAGYAVMAQAWYAGLLVAREKGWVQGVTNGTSTGVKSAGPSKEMVGWIIGFMVVSLGFVFGG
jgi:lysophospholipase L1-like esterase